MDEAFRAFLQPVFDAGYGWHVVIAFVVVVGVVVWLSVHTNGRH